MGNEICNSGSRTRTVRMWDYNDRVYSWRFTLLVGYTCDAMGNIVLAANTSVVDVADDEFGDINLVANASVLVSSTDGADVLRGSLALTPLPEAPLPKVTQPHNKDLAQMPSSALNTMQAAAFIACALVMGVAFTLAVRKSRKPSADDYHQVDE